MRIAHTSMIMILTALSNFLLAWGFWEVSRANSRYAGGRSSPALCLPGFAVLFAGVVLLELACWADGVTAAPRTAVCLAAVFLLAQQLYQAWISAQELLDCLEAELVHVLPVPLVLSAAACALLPGGLPTVLAVFTPAACSSTWPLTLALAALTGLAIKWYIGGAGRQAFDALLQGRLLPLAAAHPAALPILAAANALVEELEFRALLQTGLASMAGLAPASTPQGSEAWLQMATAVAATSGLFTLQHMAAGFPRASGPACLTFAWGCVLGLLQCLSGGWLQPFVVHLAADATLALAARREEQLLRGRGQPEEKGLPGEEKDVLAPLLSSLSRSSPPGARRGPWGGSPPRGAPAAASGHGATVQEMVSVLVC